MAKNIDEQLGNLARRLLEVERRVSEGTIPFTPTMQALQTIIEGKFASTVVWRTIKLGTYKSVKTLRMALERADNRVSDWATDILAKPAFTVASEVTEVDLVILSVEELGFKEGACYKDIYARAKELGLELCPAEVGPQLRLQYPDQTPGEWLRVAMEPITGLAGDPILFGVERRGSGRWLDARWGSSGGVWDSGDRFVFVLARPAKRDG